jgi:hypothetical protein
MRCDGAKSPTFNVNVGPGYFCDHLYPPAENNTGKTATLILGNSPGDTLAFLIYNLGAKPDMTPYEQMTYNYPWATTAADSALIPFDVRVNGGLFQWGRKDFRHVFRCQKVDGVNDEMFS